MKLSLPDLFGHVGGKEQKGGKKGGKGDEESTGPLELDLDDVEKRMKSAIDALKVS